MQFANPQYFWLFTLFVPLILWYVLKKRRSNPTLGMSTLQAFAGKGMPTRAWLRHLLFALRLAAIGCLIVILARPQKKDSWQTTNTEGDIEFRPMRVVVRGRGGKLTTGKVKAGSPMDTAITLTILYILIEVDGKTVVELDKLNEVYKVNGVDVLAKIKEMC